jgi:Raf kinase inhibitor-like YbhB/YbcL family protein
MIRKFCIAAVMLIGVLALAACEDDEDDGDSSPTTADSSTATESTPAAEMSITSTAFENNASIPVEYTCDGANTSPPLAITGVPEDAVSLALLMDDPDAPGGSFVHWTIWNIDPAAPDAAEGSAPQGSTEGLNGTGQPGYTGPCPPSGEHRYIFTVYALSGVPDLDAATSGKEELLAAIEPQIVAEAELIGLYTRG